MADFEDTTSRLDRLLNAAEPKLAEAFARMVAVIKSKLTLKDIADAIEKGLWGKAFDEALKAAPILGEAYQASFLTAARDTARVLGRGLGNIQIVFDQTNFGAVNAMQRNMLRLVQGFTNEQRELVRQIITDGIARGMNPRAIAREFKDSIGLTPGQQQAVRNFRRALETSDPAVLQRALRDRRFDSTLRAALEGRTPLTQAQIDKMVGRYTERMLGYRAETIARTEALRAVHEGAREMYDQAIASGDLDRNNLSQEWQTAMDERVRHSHAPMHGQVQPYGVPFVSGKGNSLRYPGDPDAPPEEVINCRCAVLTRMTSIAGVVA